MTKGTLPTACAEKHVSHFCALGCLCCLPAFLNFFAAGAGQQRRRIQRATASGMNGRSEGLFVW